MFLYTSVVSYATPFHPENRPSNETNEKRKHNKITHRIDFPFLYFHISTKWTFTTDTCYSVAQILLITPVQHRTLVRYSLCVMHFHCSISTESFSMNDLIFNVFRLQKSEFLKRKRGSWRKEPKKLTNKVKFMMEIRFAVFTFQFVFLFFFHFSFL